MKTTQVLLSSVALFSAVSAISFVSRPAPLHADERSTPIDCSSLNQGGGGVSLTLYNVCQSVNVLTQEVASIRQQLQQGNGGNSSLPPCAGGNKALRYDRNMHCYIGYDQELRFQDATEACRYMGGHLVSISSQEENDFVVRNFAPRDGAGNGKEIWIGFTDIRHEGNSPETIVNWEWVNGEVQPNGNSIFNLFSPGEPNNAGPNGPENCGVIHANRWGQWDDRDCTVSRSYVCERE